MRCSNLFSLSISLLISSTAAWPWPGFVDVREVAVLRRQEGSTGGSSSATAAVRSSASTVASATASSKAATTGKSTASESGSATGSSGSTAAASGASGSKGTGSSNSTTSATRTTSIDPRLPPGGVEMVTPSALAGAQYYKVGDNVTFAWNYTSLSVTPTAIDVFASCSVNNQLYPITLNKTVDPTGVVTWDTNEYQATATVPLLTETYTLVIYDASKDISAIPSAGYLAVYDQYTFGMYTPQPYTPLSEFRCATCSAALSDHERQAIGMMLGMSIITILSFSWFTGGFGVFS